MKTLPAKPVHPRIGSSHRARGARIPVRQTLPVIAAALLFVGATGEALAGRQPARADLRVQLDAPTTADINLPETYTVTVTNLGRDTSASIVANVTFPLSNTSPHVFVLGAVTPLDGRCAVVGRTLNCNLAGLRKGWSTSFLFNYAAPVSTKPLLITASASSSTADPVPGNNSASALPNLVYPSRAISTSSNTSVAVRSCTGTALTAFYECIQTPGSIQGFSAILRADRTIDLGQAGYTGTWTQNSANSSLKMEFFENLGQGPVKIVEFNGMAINGANCFHGLSTFAQGPTYVSPYEVCLP